MKFASTATATYSLSLGLILLFGCRNAENEYVAPPPPEVTVARPVQQLVTPFFQKNGETEAVAEAEVSSRVTGFIEEICFEPAQDVKKDDILYKIETTQYEAAVGLAKAAIAAADAANGVAEALVSTADAAQKKAALDLKREQELLQRGAGSQADVDNAIAANDEALAGQKSAAASVRAAEAEKESAEARLEKAQLDLDYTKVQALITGRISKTAIKQGNLVASGSVLTSIVNDDPIFANFSVSDREFLQYMESERAVLEKGEQLKEVDWRQIPVYLSREGDKGFPFEGRLDYVDPNGIDPDTGTLGLRAKFDNPAKQLIQGMFVTVRVPSGKPLAAMLIPETAINRDQRGLFVLTIGDEQKVERTEISVAKTVSGWAIIESGLTEQSLVIIDGLQRARPGLQVTPLEKVIAVDDQTLLRGLSPTAQGDKLKPDSPPSDPSETE